MDGPGDGPAIFDRLRPLYAHHAAMCVVLHDEPAKYYLGSHEVRAKDGYRTWFGGVEIKKAYVAAHVIPVYTNHELLEEVSEALRKRMQGKSCFNFKLIDEALFAELGALIERGATQFVADGKL